MKKVALTLASIAAIATFAPEASALPVFARQTGMACTACHFQHFPLLNTFGRSFKANAFTMVGSQPMLEGDNLAIPDRLNLAGLTSAYYSTQSGSGGSSPQVGVPASGGELSIFYGGKVTDNAGFLSELGMIGGAATNAAKLVILYPVGDMRAGLATYSTGQGAGYGLEYLNTGAVDAHKMMGNVGVGGEHGNAAYAARYMGAIGNATGASAIVEGGWGMASAGTYAAAPPGTSANVQALTLTYGRIVGTFDLGGWDSAVGIQTFGGSALTAAVAGAAPTTGCDGVSTTAPCVAGTIVPATLGAAGSAAAYTDYNLMIVDAQAQGEIGGMSAGFYAEFATAPASSSGHPNAFSAGGSSLLGGTAMANLKSTSLNLSTTIEVAPGATVQLAARFANLTDSNDYTASTNSAGTGPNLALTGTDNALMIGATYSLAQNLNLGANYTMQSGTAWDAVKANTGSDAIGKTAGTLSLYALF